MRSFRDQRPQNGRGGRIKPQFIPYSDSKGCGRRAARLAGCPIAVRRANRGHIDVDGEQHHGLATQIEANRRNAQKSTGPKTENGKAKARLNAMTHGLSARTVVPVLPHEDPRALDERIRSWTEDWQPQNAIEADLVSHAARLSWQIDRAERFETAHLSHRVRKAQRRAAGARIPSGSKRLPTWAASSLGLTGTVLGPFLLPGWRPPRKAAAGCWTGGAKSRPCRQRYPE